jgi:hypothetical protein
MRSLLSGVKTGVGGESVKLSHTDGEPMLDVERDLLASIPRAIGCGGLGARSEMLCCCKASICPNISMKGLTPWLAIGDMRVGVTTEDAVLHAPLHPNELSMLIRSRIFSGQMLGSSPKGNAALYKLGCLACKIAGSDGNFVRYSTGFSWFRIHFLNAPFTASRKCFLFSRGSAQAQSFLPFI